MVDSYGWIEFFVLGTKHGKYAAYIEKANVREYVTPSIVIYEVYRKLKSSAGEEKALEACAYIMSHTNVVSLTEKVALEAADFSISFGMAMADSIIAATAKANNAKIITGDEHFRKLENVELIK
ncbi:MAG: type II toxin-antitoxin system VapC family toxin [Candidatus Aenigmarchaeota archaeon]|nr:type II toxin-antitoxin system VapC family toxin [Candidatus Aenigmarchaeota archaeon]